MRNILVVAYYFPPSGGPGGQRVLKLVKYLPQFGYLPHVLTVENGDFPAVDYSLLNEIPMNVPVYRVPILEPYDLYRKMFGMKPGTAIDVNVIKKENQKTGLKFKVAEFIRSTCFIPDARIAWLYPAVKKGLELIKANNIEAIYSSSPPYTCSLIARNLKRKTKLPWIAGFRDPWTGFISSPKRWFLPAAIDKKMENSVFDEADFIEVAWEGIKKDAIKKYSNLNHEKFIHVPNGFDSADFPEVSAIKKNEKFTITYTGSLYGRRNPESLFKAISYLIKDKKIQKDDIQLKFVGRFGNEVLQMFQAAEFSDNIEIINYLPHNESIIQCQHSDSLLLIVDESKESEEIVPGKVYEYIGLKKPIIAIAPLNSAIAELLKETNSGLVAHQTDIKGISDIVLNYYIQWKTGEINFQPNDVIINSYERKESARKLADLLNTLI